MKVQINFKVINPDFDQEYANDYQYGKENPGNLKYLYEVGYQVVNATSVELIKNGIFQLVGTFPDGTEFSYPIPNVTIFRCQLKEGSHEDFAVSESILAATHQAEKQPYKTIRCYFYIHPEPRGRQLSPQLFINQAEIPGTLLA